MDKFIDGQLKVVFLISYANALKNYAKPMKKNLQRKKSLIEHFFNRRKLSVVTKVLST